MKKELFTEFNSRQYMQSKEFEIFYYNDVTLDHVSPHSHDHYELYYFIEGDVDYVINGVPYSLQYGDYLLIPPGTPHHPIFRTKSTPYRRFILWFSKDYYEQLCTSCQDFSYSFDYVTKTGQYLFRTDFIIHQKIQGELLEMIEEMNSARPFRDLSLSLLVPSFLLHLNRITYDLCHQVSTSYENVLYLNICDYINNHLTEDLTLEYLASFFYVSKYHICHIFKDNMGISLHQYIIKKRIQASKNGILSGLPFTKVFHQYGFHDYTSFYRAFKKEFGLSPKEFKEQHKLPEDF